MRPGEPRTSDRVWAYGLVVRLCPGIARYEELQRKGKSNLKNHSVVLNCLCFLG
jgi:hypothetical protein